MKKKLMIFLLLIVTALSHAQSDTSRLAKISRNRYAIALIPSGARNIYGIAIGPVGSEAFCNLAYTKYSHGLNLQIPGQGFFQVFYIKSYFFGKAEQTPDNDSLAFYDTLPLRAVHNGLIISPFGTFTPKVNGISLSLFMSMGRTVNGISINPLWNLYEKINGFTIGVVNTVSTMKGVQIGIFNKTANLHGVQIGLWNKNQKRSLPILNWNFKRSEKRKLAEDSGF
jgi:hypothetical protein